MDILYEKEVIDFLRLPGIPKKYWDGRRSFRDGVAIVELYGGRQAYAVATFDSERDMKPRISHVFSQEQFSFTDYEHIAVVPEYMNADGIESWDIDDESKKAAQYLVEEAKELEYDGIENQKVELPENEYCYDHIHNDEEARAFIKSWNHRNGYNKGKVPTRHDEIVAKLTVMYADDNRKK